MPLHRVTPLLALSLLACGAPEPVVTEPTARAALEAQPPQLAEGVIAMESVCSEGAEEVCDALDSDCDGRIDEGCPGVADGELAVAVAWNGPAALTLVLEGPEGNTATARGGCDDPTLTGLSLDHALPGVYSVALEQTDACGADAPITASVTVAAGGRVVGTFNRGLSPSARAEVVSVELR